MPNLRSQSVSLAGIELVASDGRRFSLTSAQVVAHFQGLNGGRNARIAATIQWVKDSIEAALGPEQVPAALIDFDWHDTQGFRRLGVRG